MKRNIFKSGISQYALAVAAVAATSAICYVLARYLGYQSISLILLFMVSILATFLGIGPVLLAASLSAFIWDVFFIPPRYTIHIERTEDILMLGMFFIIALINGVLTTRVRKQERLARDREERTNALYQLNRNLSAAANKAQFLEESDKLYKTLFNSISHELRIPVATIMGASDSLLSSVHPEAIRVELLTEILKASERLNRLIENLLNMSRLEGGRIKPRPDWHDVHDLVNEVCENLKEELSRFRVQVNIPEDMPPVKIDFGLMEQVLYNLVHNASQYAPPSTEIGISAFYSDGLLNLQITDRGPGFPENEISLIFNKFYRVGGSKPGGTGLGLSIAKGFVEAHKGMITVENRSDGGAMFRISIPAETFREDINQ
ncbi:MAG TPA: sensor histidine kinase [Bacteroidales bacterium]|nr:sensor histidine kinase [Bacteroidales bacterium]